MIPITLFGPKESVNVDALIDSGADRCLFDVQIGREIGLDIGEWEKEIFSGIEGGKVIAYLHKIELQIIGIEKRIILGQDEFFDAFKIKFEKDHNMIEITPVKKWWALINKKVRQAVVKEVKEINREEGWRVVLVDNLLTTFIF